MPALMLRRMPAFEDLRSVFIAGHCSAGCCKLIILDSKVDSGPEATTRLRMHWILSSGNCRDRPLHAALDDAIHRRCSIRFHTSWAPSLAAIVADKLDVEIYHLLRSGTAFSLS